MANVKPLYELSLERRPRYLYAHVKGPRDSVPIDRSYFGEIRAECRAGNIDRVLIEEDLGTQLSMMDVYEVASGLPAQDVAGIKIAFVDRYPTHEDGNRFGETVARNRGVRVKVCPSVAEAEAWLLQP